MSNAGQVRSSLIAWAQSLAPEAHIASLYDVRSLFVDSKLSNLLDELEKALYGSNGKEALHYDALLQQLKHIRQTGSGEKKSGKADSLQPLYE